METVKMLTTIVLFAGTIGQDTFVAWYGLTMPWWGSQPGRSIFLKSASLALLLTVDSAGVIFGQSAIVHFVSLTIVATAIYYQLGAFMSISSRAAMAKTLRAADDVDDVGDDTK